MPYDYYTQQNVAYLSGRAYQIDDRFNQQSPLYDKNIKRRFQQAQRTNPNLDPRDFEASAPTPIQPAPGVAQPSARGRGRGGRGRGGRGRGGIQSAPGTSPVSVGGRGRGGRGRGGRGRGRGGGTVGEVPSAEQLAPKAEASMKSIPSAPIATPVDNVADGIQKISDFIRKNTPTEPEAAEKYKAKITDKLFKTLRKSLEGKPSQSPYSPEDTLKINRAVLRTYLTQDTPLPTSKTDLSKLDVQTATNAVMSEYKRDPNILKFKQFLKNIGGYDNSVNAVYQFYRGGIDNFISEGDMPIDRNALYNRPGGKTLRAAIQNYIQGGADIQSLQGFKPFSEYGANVKESAGSIDVSQTINKQFESFLDKQARKYETPVQKENPINQAVQRFKPRLTASLQERIDRGQLPIDDNIAKARQEFEKLPVQDQASKIAGLGVAVGAQSNITNPTLSETEQQKEILALVDEEISRQTGLDVEQIKQAAPGTTDRAKYIAAERQTRFGEKIAIVEAAGTLLTEREFVPTDLSNNPTAEITGLLSDISNLQQDDPNFRPEITEQSLRKVLLAQNDFTKLINPPAGQTKMGIEDIKRAYGDVNGSEVQLNYGPSKARAIAGFKARNKNDNSKFYFDLTPQGQAVPRSMSEYYTQLDADVAAGLQPLQFVTNSFDNTTFLFESEFQGVGVPLLRDAYQDRKGLKYPSTGLGKIAAIQRFKIGETPVYWAHTNPNQATFNSPPGGVQKLRPKGNNPITNVLGQINPNSTDIISYEQITSGNISNVKALSQPNYGGAATVQYFPSGGGETVTPDIPLGEVLPQQFERETGFGKGHTVNFPDGRQYELSGVRKTTRVVSTDKANKREFQRNLRNRQRNAAVGLQPDYNLKSEQFVQTAFRQTK